MKALKSLLFIISAACAGTVATVAHSATLQSLAGLVSVDIYETSSAAGGLLVPSGDRTIALLTERRSGRLSTSNRDFQSQAGEYYDFFFSNADGTFNADGEYLTIEAIFDNQSDAGLNIAAAGLNFGSNVVEWASTVESFESFGAFAFPNTAANALGDNLSTTTFLGDTFGTDNRLRLTLGFASSTLPDDHTVIPIPASLPLILAGLGSLGLLSLRRGRSA